MLYAVVVPTNSPLLPHTVGSIAKEITKGMKQVLGPHDFISDRYSWRNSVANYLCNIYRNHTQLTHSSLNPKKFDRVEGITNKLALNKLRG